MKSQVRIALLVDRARISAQAEGVVLFGWDSQFIKEKLMRAGIPSDWITYHIVGENSISELNEFPNLTVLIPTEPKALKLTSGKSSITKWHLSPLDAEVQFKARKVIPTFHPDSVKLDMSLGLYVEKAFVRARTECETPEYVRKPKHFLLNPPLEQTYEILRFLETLDSTHWLAVDIETGAGQINTIGFAWSESNAIAIQVLPDRCSAENYYAIWSHIKTILLGPTRKIFQNGLYEVLYFARYGLHVSNFAHDTMNAQKFLWPELDKGLDNVGRLYTNEPYWKDMGRVESEEGKTKDWANVRDWMEHFTYNCMDTTGTFEACMKQRVDLERRGMLKLFDEYLMQIHRPMREMCLRGLPLDETLREQIKSETQAEINSAVSKLSKEINHRSPKQKLELFRSKGYVLPKKHDRKAGTSRESVDELSLKKLRLKYPEDSDIPLLLDIAGNEKAISSYLNVENDPTTKQIHFSMDIHGTETGRFSSYSDPWGRGFNAQTIPSYAKKMIRWPSPDRVFVQCDLKQAESRFVAYDSCDENLISCLENPLRDIHKEVAAEIFEKPISEITKSERQLGKKSGHGANYSMGVNTFQESCLKEMDLVLSKEMASKTLEAYHRLFPGIRKWHYGIKTQLFNKRMLTNPFGRVRYFYGRMDDNTFREAYAYRPQSTVPDIVNHLMLGLESERTAGNFKFWFHLQCHDSVTLSCTPDQVERIVEFCSDTSKWHPEVRLGAGLLVIPTEVEVGPGLGELKVWEGKL